MKAALISLGSVSSKLTAEAMRKYFKAVDELNIKKFEINLAGRSSQVLYEGKPLGEYDCIYAKGSFRYAPILSSITTILHDKSYLPISPKAFTIAHDKLLTQLDLGRANIPMPKTYLSSTIEAAKEILEKTNYPVIMKFPQGTQGKGVMFAESYATASSILDALGTLKQAVIIQEYIETGTSDLRVIVVGDKVAAAMKRKGSIREKRANIHAGGVGEPYEPDELIKKIAVDAARVLGADICGVDILMGAKGPLVIEANISPGLQGIQKATKIDVADRIGKFLFKKSEERRRQLDKGKSRDIMAGLDGELPKATEFISNLDFRGTRILLPELATKASGFSEQDNFKIKVEKNRILIKKFDVK